MRTLLLLLALTPVLHAQAVSRSADGRVYWVENPMPGETFQVYVGKGDVPPVLGAFSAENGRLVFRPRFLLADEVRAIFRGVVTRFPALRAAPVSSTVVEAVYPTADRLPENLLKFYVVFSGPMQRGEGWTRLQLLKANGTPVELPFLEIDQELWDPGNRRFTILFDPGRIKRGVLPLNEVGPALVVGETYTLVVDAAWRDAAGAPLRTGYRKKFTVTEAERRPIEPSAWRVVTPRAGSRDPLTVEFGRPLDAALALRLITRRGGSSCRRRRGRRESIG
ncbi:MAG: hypothetical protein B7X34_09795 [Acidobacteriia bacterium 12-62-4]|nr:MAG: hypothetical protein B7X34_09795 [Acidobacteriia bacterium 12-62-4]